MSVAEDLEFQFETLLNTLIYEREYMNIKAQKVNRQVLGELTPKLDDKKRLRDLLEGIYEGQ
jgi:hypothetical protein